MTLEYQHRVDAVDRSRDGDTSEFTVRLTPRIREGLVGRLMGWDCPESRRPASDYEIRRSRDALAIALTAAATAAAT